MGAMLADKKSVQGIKAGASEQWPVTQGLLCMFKNEMPSEGHCSALIASRMAEPKWGPRVWVDMR